MQQYREIKGRHQNAILFFRMGEFYEMFYEDAETASRVLGLTLTSRNNGGAAEVPLAGVPVKAAGDYVRRLVQQGFRVAICEQVEDPKTRQGRGPPRSDRDGHARRGVRRRSARRRAQQLHLRVSRADAGSGNGPMRRRRRGGRVDRRSAADRRDRRRARSAARATVAARDAGRRRIRASPLPRVAQTSALVTEREAWEFDEPLAREDLARQYGVLSLEGLGIDEERCARRSARPARCCAICASCSRRACRNSRGRAIERPGGMMPLDEMTRRNLELVESLRGGGVEGTLLSVLDRTGTPMGARLLRQWILAPLTIARRDRRAARRRGDAAPPTSSRATRCATRSTTCATSSDSRQRPPPGAQHAARAARARRFARARCRPSRPRCSALRTDAGRLARDPRAVGRLPRSSRRRSARRSSSDRRSRSATSRRSRRASTPSSTTLRESARRRQGRDRAHSGRGARAHRHRVAQDRLQQGVRVLHRGHELEPRISCRADYQRRQTITSGERFVTPALKEYEEKRADARPSGSRRASASCSRRCAPRRAREIARLQRIARAIAELDVLSTLADVAAREGYVRPTMTDEFDLEIVAGRHPVVERMMPRDKFIPNDLRAAARRADDHSHRPEHGRQVDGAASDRTDRADGADRKLRSGDARRGSAWSTASSRAWARATISCAASRRSWWR